jgi:hypothetical protein
MYVNKLTRGALAVLAGMILAFGLGGTASAQSSSDGYGTSGYTWSN